MYGWLQVSRNCLLQLRHVASKNLALVSVHITLVIIYSQSLMYRLRASSSLVFQNLIFHKIPTNLGKFYSQAWKSSECRCKPSYWGTVGQHPQGTPLVNILVQGHYFALALVVSTMELDPLTCSLQMVFRIFPILFLAASPPGAVTGHSVSSECRNTTQCPIMQRSMRFQVQPRCQSSTRHLQYLKLLERRNRGIDPCVHSVH